MSLGAWAFTFHLGVSGLDSWTPAFCQCTARKAAVRMRSLGSCALLPPPPWQRLGLCFWLLAAALVALVCIGGNESAGGRFLFVLLFLKQ